ncbi:hypothetical protein BU26DRAFT_513280 [Trematosphaeria pertusa]|uniref:Uncharacterized protein n=1 Tax=Trematosphaeria pertusa TaxID=390896 RepID=A0A6A6J232_9PLEO|nr:uncharacterized protein BU26DRAFT_513280 [Trematosphaeria pertusa]KAF2256451.1 hypothetical protein BU26DRAFT_513280 [Trematosphaeria pertusa]
MAILFQLAFCVAVAVKYWDAVRVYIQRDDGVSDSGWQRRKGGRKAASEDRAQGGGDGAQRCR